MFRGYDTLSNIAIWYQTIIEDSHNKVGLDSGGQGWLPREDNYSTPPPYLPRFCEAIHDLTVDVCICFAKPGFPDLGKSKGIMFYLETPADGPDSVEVGARGNFIWNWLRQGRVGKRR